MSDRATTSAPSETARFEAVERGGR
ncbi:MAG: hypothetical protein JWN41_1371, partial [Thermoleophilia bacterium]|nr:hypothetical protein [Thermoleophilia bacterium]